MDWKNKLNINVEKEKIVEQKETLDFNYETTEINHVQINDSDIIVNAVDNVVTSKDLEFLSIAFFAWLGLIFLIFTPQFNSFNHTSLFGFEAQTLLFFLKMITAGAGSFLIQSFIVENKATKLLPPNWVAFISDFKFMKKKCKAIFTMGFLSINMLSIMNTMIPEPIKPVEAITKQSNSNTQKDIVVNDSRSKVDGNYQYMVDLAKIQEAKEKEERAKNDKYLLDSLKKTIHDKEQLKSTEELLNQGINLTLSQEQLYLKEEQLKIAIEKMQKNKDLNFSLSDMKEENIKLKQELENIKLQHNIAILKRLQK